MENKIQNSEHAMTARAQVLVFGFLCAVSIVFWWHCVVITCGIALSNDAYTHILLIVPLSTALIYQDSKYRDLKNLQIDLRPTPRIGAGLLVLALLIGGYARWGMVVVSDDLRLSLGMLALVTWWIGGVILCFGVDTFRSFLFPLCFLFWMVPAPAVVLNGIVHFLQHQSAFAARILFQATGVPVTQDGIMLAIPNLNIEVATECSSIRSSLMLVVTTMVLAHLFLRSGWRKTLLVAAAVPLSVAKNGLRIFTIAELGTRVDPGFLNGKLHHNGGIIFFGISVVAMVALLWILRRTEFQMSLEHPVESTQ
jgi:exosortase